MSLRDHLVERLRRLDGVTGRADRPRVAIGAEPGRRTEVELRPGGVDEVVVLEVGDLALAGRIGVAHRHVRARQLGAALAVQLDRERLVELDALALVDGCERERHLLDGHLADADPDVRRDPVPLRVRCDHDDVVLLADHAAQVQRGGVAGDACAEDDGASHGYPRRYGWTVTR